MPLPAWELSTNDLAVCTSCGSRNTVRAFPAALQSADAAARPEAAVDGEGACFDHPNQRAVADCRQCGRFVCQLCSVEFGAEIWCPSCVAAGSGKARRANLETSRTLFDSIALILPLSSLILWPFTAIAAPAGLVIALVKWNRPLSVVRRSRWRFVAAILVGLAEIAGWIALLVYLAARAKARLQ
jgi:hypothetical protein